MIKYNSNTINDWNFDASNVIKVYRNNAIVFYKVSGESPTPEYKVCFAVVKDISVYQDTEFEDVYDKATEKWYKLNNLNEYEEYGVYGNGRNITTYNGKLTIDNGYEYEWNGSSWVNLGEVREESILPQGYTVVEYVENTSSAYINTNLVLFENIGDSFEIKVKTYFTPYGNDFEYLFCTEQTSSPYTGIQLRYYQKNLQYNSDSNVVWTHIDNGDGTSGVTASCSSINATNGGNPLTLFCGLWSTGPWRFGIGKIYSFTVTKNNSIVRDLVPCKRDSDSKYGMYDIVNDVFYASPNNVDFIGGEPITEYPKYYTEKSAPLDNLTFNTLQEAETYAYNNCVYDGMKATIDGKNYMFDSEYGWVENTYSLPNVPFMINYNAKEYDASTNTLPKTEGQLRNSDAVCNYGYHIVDHSADGYITVTGNTRMVISGTPYFNRTNTRTGCTMTIVSKVKTTDVVESYSILTNRGNYGTMNWMWRYPSNAIFLHGSSSYSKPKYFTSTTEKPIIASIRINYDDSLKQLLNDWTNNGSYNGAFQYGSTYNGDNAMFCDYTSIAAEFWKGDFYWVYMSFVVLTDEQIQQVIDYNENL